MNKLAQVLLAFAAPLCLLAADFPEGTGAIEITEPGTYTATEDRTFESLTVSTVGPTVFDQTGDYKDVRFSFTGSDIQFNITEKNADVGIRGGFWDFGKVFRMGNDGGAGAGQSSNRRLFVSDGAVITNVTKFYINERNGGNELYVSNATIAAETMYVQDGASLTATTSPAEGGKLFIGENGQVRLSTAFYVQTKYTSTNSKQAGEAHVIGPGALLASPYVYVGFAQTTKAERGSVLTVEDGARLESGTTIDVGNLDYTTRSNLTNLLAVVDSTADFVQLRNGVAENVRNNIAMFSNSTVTATGDVISGYGVNSSTNSIVFSDCANVTLANLFVGFGDGSHDNFTVLRDCANTTLSYDLSVGSGDGSHDNFTVFSDCTNMTLSDDLFVGSGEGSHGNFVGFCGCGPIELTSGKSWYSGKGAGSYGNTLLFSNTVVQTDREVAAGGNATSHDNEVVVAGPQGRVVMTHNQRDPISYGHYNRFRVTDRATLSIENSSFWLFKAGYDSEIVIENGGTLTNGLGQTLSIVVGKATGTPPSPHVTSGNSLVFRNGGCGNVSGELQICGTNDALVVSDASIRIASHLSVGYQQQVTTSDKTVTNLVPSARCRLVVAGTHPKITIDKNLNLIEGAQSVLRFEPVGDGFSWPDEPTRPAPIVQTSASYSFFSYDDTVFEADVSKLNPSARGTPIAVVSSKKAIVMSETALANANAKGALAKKPYHFSLSDDKKTLYLTAESRGLMLMFR